MKEFIIDQQKSNLQLYENVLNLYYQQQSQPYDQKGNNNYSRISEQYDSDDDRGIR